MSAENEPAELEVFIQGFQAAIDEEILAIQDDLARRGIGQPVQASGGHEAPTDSAGFLYDWTLPPGRYVIRVDDAVRVSCHGGETLGFVSRWESSSRVLRVAVTDWMGRLAGPAELTFDPTWLLTTLDGRLAAIETEPTSYHTETALRLFGARFPDTGAREVEALHRDGLNPCQVFALERILGSRTQLVWGPPGTGKTLLLGHAVRALADEGRVLVLATTNVAVDEAARRVAEQMCLEAVSEGCIVRVGAAHSRSGNIDLSIESLVQRREEREPGRLTRLLGELEGELGLARAGPATAGLHQRYGAVLASARTAASPGALARAGHLTSELQRAGAGVVSRADVVLTTFARLTLRDDLWGQRFQSVFVDEASTAPLPYVFAGACLASRRAIAVGDFQQLPAVVMARGGEAKRWLSRDIFRQSGSIAPEVGRTLPDPKDALCAMLTEQYRMAPQIRVLVSDLFYGSRLTDAPSVTDRPSRAPPLVLVDTGALSPQVERAEGSRANAIHVDILLQLIEILTRRGVADVGVVTPYRLQARRIFQQVRSRLGRLAPAGLEIATIHRFQGREKETVILDTVDAPPGGSWFLNEERNPDFPRLLNVAMSRSRQTLIVVGTSEGLSLTLPSDALLVRALDVIRQTGTVIDGDLIARGGHRLLET
ncbi:MAG: AAA family ATPase [Gemmatimonadetes bacterium]|nr:AAA family ATPase [Gemmatimonadota bacterium]